MSKSEHFKAWLLVGLFFLLVSFLIPILGHIFLIFFICITTPIWLFCIWLKGDLKSEQIEEEK